MSGWVALLLIVALVVYAKQRADRQQSGGGGGSDAPSSETQRELADLRKRVEVLERIITDERSRDRLAQEIEALRGDTPAP